MSIALVRLPECLALAKTFVRQLKLGKFTKGMGLLVDAFSNKDNGVFSRQKTYFSKAAVRDSFVMYWSHFATFM